MDKRLTIKSLLFILDCSFKNSVLTLTAVAVVEKSIEEERDFLISRLSIYCFRNIVLHPAVVHFGVGGIYSERNL